jgi:hypothetical protein
MTKLKSENSGTDIHPEQHHNYTLAEVLDGYVQSPEGAVFVVTKDGKNVAQVILRHGSHAVVVPAMSLLLHLNVGQWVFSKEIIESMQYPVLTEAQQAHKHSVLKALLYGQLALEANETLTGTLDHDKYLANTLRKSNKELERKSSKNLTGVYGANPEMLTNLFTAMDRFVGRMVAKMPHEVFFLDLVMDAYEADPSGWQEKPVSLDKLDSE